MNEARIHGSTTRPARLRWSLGGAEGNERLTVAVALVLLILLAAEGFTILDLGAYLAVHIFIGLLLLPAVTLKIASASWRAARYYIGGSEYRLRGPPQILLRALAPPLVIATVVLFGTGVAFLVVGHGHGLLLSLHAASFVVWFALMVVHVLAYLPRIFRGALTDWRPRQRLPGGGLRRVLVVGSVVAGLVIGLATWSIQSSWLAHRHHEHRHAEAG